MKNVRIITLILAVVMLLSLFSGCANTANNDKNTTSGKETANTASNGQSQEESAYFSKEGYPIVKEKITLKLLGIDNPDQRRNWEENKFFKRMEEMTNIHFEFTQLDANTYAEKKSLMFASGDLPDVFFKLPITPQEEATYGGQGLLIPLEGLIKDYAPNLNKILSENEDIRRIITLPSDKIVTLPGLSKGGSWAHFYLNKVWMDKLGMPEPVTVEDFYNVLKAFKEKDPNGNGKQDEIPFSIVATDMTQLKLLMAPWGIMFNEANVFINDSGKVVFSPQQNEFKDALKFYRKLYEEKLLDNEIFTQDWNQIAAKGKGGDVFGGFFHGAAYLAVDEKRADDYVTMLPVKLTPEGKQINPVWPFSNFPAVNRGTMAITNKCKYPEAMMRWFDYIYSEEGGRLVWAGKEGEEYKMSSDGTWDWILKEGQGQDDVRMPGTIQGTVDVGLAPQEFFDKINNPQEAKLNKLRKRVQPFDVSPFPAVTFEEGDQKRLNTLNTDITKYVDQMMARFITGDAAIDSEWDNYLATLQKMKVDDLVKIYQKAYDEFKSR